MTHAKVDAYLDDLRTALEVRGASEDQIADILRQTRSHLVDAGEDPSDAFGSPHDYAKQYAPHSTPTRFWVLIIASVVLATTGGWFLVNGIINHIGEKAMLWGLNPLVGIFAGSLLLATWIAALVVVGARPARRDGSRN